MGGCMSGEGDSEGQDHSQGGDTTRSRRRRDRDNTTVTSNHNNTNTTSNTGDHHHHHDILHRSHSLGGVRKNHPLCHETIRWKSEVPLTEGQLRSKRDEFWDTAPAFDGRKEIWDALRAASLAAEAMDFQLAQAIIDGANVTLPNGYLTECYDELGTRYQVPVYCLSSPINMVRGGGRDSPAEYSEPVEGGVAVTLRLRLSTTCRDVKLTVDSKDTFNHCKKKLQKQEGLEPSRQRWFFGGKLLGDKMIVEDAHINPGYVIQVIVNMEDLIDS